MSNTFLTAEWRHLVMLNYTVDRKLLEPRVLGLELDTFHSAAYVSVVGFLFLRLWRAPAADFKADVPTLYGEQFIEPLSVPPAPAFVAEGSTVVVRRGSAL